MHSNVFYNLTQISFYSTVTLRRGRSHTHTYIRPTNQIDERNYYVPTRPEVNPAYNV